MYEVLCFSELMNAFNGVITVRRSTTYNFRTEERTYNWSASMGGTSYSMEEAKLMMTGMTIAMKLMNGDESDVTSEKESMLFYDMVKAKRALEDEQKRIDREEHNRKKAEEHKKVLAELAKLPGNDKYGVKNVSNDKQKSFMIYNKQTGEPIKKGYITRYFKTDKAALKYISEL